MTHGIKQWAIPAVPAILGLLSYWANRHVMYPDGISYLEVGDAIFRDGWVAAANGCWSPLLALLAGAARAVFRPSAFGEFRFANGVNALIYLCSIVILELAIRRYWRRNGDGAILSRLQLGMFLHTVHIVAALTLVGMNYFTPDILLIACANLALAAIFGPAGPANSALLGLALGLGYLGKTAFLVTGGLLWISAGMIWRRRGGMPRDLLISGTVFAAISALYFVPVSIQKKRFTLAENGRVNYVMHVLGVRNPAAGDPRFGPPPVPVTHIADTPLTYELPHWTGVAYPPHYDMSRFFDGWQYSISLAGHAKAIEKSLRIYARIPLRGPVLALLVTFAALLVMAQRRAPSPLLWLLLPVFGSLAAFAVIHVEGPRYTAPLFVPAFFGLLACLGVPKPERQRLSGWILAAAAAFCALVVLRAAAGSVLIRDVHPEAQFARALAGAGAEPGDAMATIGRGLDCAWARVGDYRIAAETPDRESYRKASPEQREELASRLRSRGIRAIVARTNGAVDPGWTQVPGTGWCFRMLN